MELLLILLFILLIPLPLALWAIVWGIGWAFRRSCPRCGHKLPRKYTVCRCGQELGGFQPPSARTEVADLTSEQEEKIAAMLRDKTD